MTSLRDKALLMMNIHCLGRNLATASSSLLPVQLPAPREVHFWYVLPDEVKSTNLLNRYLEILSPCEKENIITIRGEQIRKRALLARALVRTTLARYQTNCQIDPKSLKFRKNNYGKPELDWQYADDWSRPPLHFNISHTSSLIACGVTVGSARLHLLANSHKISTLPLCVTAAQFSHRLLLLFPSTIFSRVGARFFQERCLNFLCQVLHPWTTFSVLFGVLLLILWCFEL
ncbi:hypothetical protein V8G54_028866 [Vigna mungo]|uniref:holo-[acyl-carrier-protein] synthase n=1 Tax=Vigna mungo TaxID=3915 RepID=A0AAQ3RM30_VIGMU